MAIFSNSHSEGFKTKVFFDFDRRFFTHVEYITEEKDGQQMGSTIVVRYTDVMKRI